MKKIITSLRNFAHLTSVHGYERIGITTNEIKGITASMAFEVPARPGSPAAAAAEERRAGSESGADLSIKGKGTAERNFAELN